MNPTFKKDIRNTFFTDFAKIVNLSGIRLKAVITNVHVNPKKTGKFLEEYDADTVKRTGLKVSFRKKDLPVSVSVGDEVELEYKKYTVFDLIDRHEIVNLYLQNFEE